MVNITCIRGNGDRPAQDIVSPLLATIPAALHRGRIELDEGELSDEVTFVIPMTNISLGKTAYVEDLMLQSWIGKIIGVQHHASLDDNGNLDAITTISLRVLRNASS